MTYFNNLGQARVGWRIPSGGVTPTTLWTSVYGVWNADTLGTSLDTSIFRVYNGDNVNDTSGNAQNGTNVGGVTFTTGKIGNAFTFNGSNYISLPDNSLNSLTGDFSVACWVKIGSSSGSKMIIGNLTEATPGGARQGFRFEVNGTILQIDISNASGTTSLQAGANPLTVGVWYHVVLTRQGSTRTRIYVNGAISVTNSDTRNPSILPTMYTTIGANRYGTSSLSAYFNGNLDAVTVWNKELTADEVLSLYNEGTGAEYPFSSQTLPSLNDATPNANNGTRPSSTLTGGVLGPSFTTGKIGKAFTFDGINDYVALPDNSLNLTGQISVSLWWYVNPTNDQVFIGNRQRNGGGVNHGWQFRYNTSAFIFRIMNLTTDTEWAVSNSLPIGSTGTWIHVVAVKNSSSDFKLYINNVQYNMINGIPAEPAYLTNQKCTIGNVWNGSAFDSYMKNGSKIDALNVWNRALTQADVTELYNAGTGKQYPN